MKYLGLLLIVVFAACSNNDIAGTYGDESITADGAVPASEVLAKLTEGDTLDMKVKGNVSAACQAKGCWMSMDLDENESMTVTFKDYGFFVPKNTGGHEAVIAGKAFIKTTSVAQLQEMARDAEKTEDEIAAITEPKKAYHFVADGVLIL